MQEDVQRRTVALSVNATKLTAKVLAKAFLAVVRKIQKEHRAGQTPQGRQSVKKLMNHGEATNTIPLDGDTRMFDRVARKWNVDYSFHKTGPKKYLLLFKSKQADAITGCLSEYAKQALRKERRPSILQQLRSFADKERSKPQEHEHKREAVRDER